MGSFCRESGARLILKYTSLDPHDGSTAADCAAENQYFAELLPILLSTVSQQFLHMLILRGLRQARLAARIKEVDDNDFVSAMLAVELLVRRGFGFVIPTHTIAPGACVASIMNAEIKSERAMETSLAAASAVKSTEGLLVIDRLKEPRIGYRRWLASYTADTKQEEVDSRTRKTVRALASQCLNFMEQAMLDAFVFWEANNKEAADISWRMSGAAMLHVTAIAELCGSAREGISISISSSQPQPEIKQEETERLLVNQCSKMAHSAAYCCPDPIVTNIFLEIAADYEKIARLRSNPSIQLGLGHSRVFEDFQKGRDRMRDGKYVI